MSKRLILVLTLAFVMAIAFAAYAEVQNVKISGDLTVMGVARDNLDLAKTPDATLGAGGALQGTYDDKESDMLSITRVRIDADLTDNVATTVRLLNERNWNGESATGQANDNQNIGRAATSTNHEESQIDLDLAYVTLKEFLYSPLTLTVGRQELKFGNGWIVGDPDTNGIAGRSALAEGDLSARKSFDALRANLNYDPLVIDLIYAKIQENSVVRNDDVTLTGINANYALNKETTLEGFYFQKVTDSGSAAVTNVDGASDAVSSTFDTRKNKADIVNTVGARVVNKSVKNLTLDLQSAFQFGTYNPKFDPNARWTAVGAPSAEVCKRQAWGLEAAATYDLKDISRIAKYSPSVSGAYVYLSGADRDKVGKSLYRGWSAMFEDQTFGHLINAIMGFSNIHLGGLNLKAKPVEDLGVSLDYVAAWFAKRFPEGRLANLSGVNGARTFRMGKDSYAGQEVDLTLTYDYTEDVQFSLLGGLFLPGKSINEGYDSTGAVNGVNNVRERAAAAELIGSMKVTF